MLVEMGWKYDTNKNMIINKKNFLNLLRKDNDRRKRRKTRQQHRTNRSTGIEESVITIFL